VQAQSQPEVYKHSAGAAIPAKADSAVEIKKEVAVDFRSPDDYQQNDELRLTELEEIRRNFMKYICLGYIEPDKFENMSESERNTMLDECFSYNDELRKNGHLVAEEPLQPANTAVTVSWKDGKVAVTDGPYAETKEQLGGIQVLEARDLNHAIQLISQSPGVKLQCGTIEIRPAADIKEIMRESERRRTATGR
jgi:hypothetical protein